MGHVISEPGTGTKLRKKWNSKILSLRCWWVALLYSSQDMQWKSFQLHMSCTRFSHIYNIHQKPFLSKQALCHGWPYVNFFLMVHSIYNTLFLTHTQNIHILHWTHTTPLELTPSYWANCAVKAANLLTYMWPKKTSQCTFHYTVSLQDLLQDSNLQFLGFTTGWDSNPLFLQKGTWNIGATTLYLVRCWVRLKHP